MEYKRVMSILHKHNLEDHSDIDSIIDLDSNLYEDLYSYYLNNGEMPYDVQKARSETPDIWLSNRLEELGIIQ